MEYIETWLLSRDLAVARAEVELPRTTRSSCSLYDCPLIHNMGHSTRHDYCTRRHPTSFLQYRARPFPCKPVPSVHFKTVVCVDSLVYCPPVPSGHCRLLYVPLQASPRFRWGVDFTSQTYDVLRFRQAMFLPSVPRQYDCPVRLHPRCILGYIHPLPIVSN